MNSLDNLYKDILSNLDEYIYVVDLTNFKIHYISPKLREELPKFNEELPCYVNIANSSNKCITCPYNFLSAENRSLSLNIYNPLFGKLCNNKFLYSEQNETPYLTVILSPEKALLQEEDTKRDEMYKVLTNITRILGPTDNVEVRLSECLEDITQFYNADGCCFYQINRNKTYYNSGQAQEYSIFLPDENMINEWNLFFTQGRILKLSKDKSLYYTHKLAEQFGMDDIVAVCVKKAGEIVGYLYVLNPKKNEDMTILLSSAAPFIESELDADDKTSRLDYLAYTDFLTGLKNRTSYNETIKKLEESNIPLGIIFVDINGLKQGNDTYGHEYGDRMIKIVAADLALNFKDNIYRIGGDEFVMFFANVTEEAFYEIVANYKSAMQKEISVSLGAKWFKNSEDIEKKISEADKLMYEEKVKYHTTHDRRRR